MLAKPLANSALYQRSDDCRPNAPTGRDAEPGRALIPVPARSHQQHERGRVQANALARHPLIVASLAEAVAAP